MNVRNVEEPALFLTRWVTHFCAPLFIFLAGASAYLYGTRSRTLGEVSRFLLTRGLWLIVLQFTIVRLGWTFSIDLDFFVAQVIWTIGAAMVALAGLAYLPSTSERVAAVTASARSLPALPISIYPPPCPQIFFAKNCWRGASTIPSLPIGIQVEPRCRVDPIRGA